MGATVLESSKNNERILDLNIMFYDIYYMLKYYDFLFNSKLLIISLFYVNKRLI